jgi:hypothetical protein
MKTVASMISLDAEWYRVRANETKVPAVYYTSQRQSLTNVETENHWLIGEEKGRESKRKGKENHIPHTAPMHGGAKFEIVKDLSTST